MKRLFTVLAAAGTLAFIGCASEGPTGEELGEQFGRGIRGEGRLTTDIDRTDDRYVRPREGPPPPKE